ncbi:MAG: ATP-binding cassette domain-containing protein [Synergistota bacterium]|nr:ATP-binding cassette domain-containing protein [Synergistota bacterium]
MEEILRVSEAFKRFDGHQVLKGVSFALAAGEAMALMGPSGCGKTTVLRLVLRLVNIEDGEVHLFGRNVAEADEEELIELRRRIGVVFQGGALFDSMSVGDNVAFPLYYCLGVKDRKAVSERVEEILTAVGLEGAERLLPAELSGGMRKRVAIARALVYRPQLLLLDEPSTGLDPITARLIDELVLKLKETFNVGVLMVTHDIISALGVSDKIFLMDEGRIVWAGTPLEWHKSQDPNVLRFASGLRAVRRGERIEP